MSTSFLERSRLERKVLDTVNGKFKNIVELEGLSAPTLERWRKNISQFSSATQGLDLDKVNSLLREISQRISSDSDSSKHIFVEGFFLKNSTVEVCVEELERTLNSVNI